jgi:hypothetical protein
VISLSLTFEKKGRISENEYCDRSPQNTLIGAMTADWLGISTNFNNKREVNRVDDFFKKA